jgi:hypothetical protein
VYVDQHQRKKWPLAATTCLRERAAILLVVKPTYSIHIMADLVGYCAGHVLPGLRAAETVFDSTLGESGDVAVEQLPTSPQRVLLTSHQIERDSESDLLLLSVSDEPDISRSSTSASSSSSAANRGAELSSSSDKASSGSSSGRSSACTVRFAPGPLLAPDETPDEKQTWSQRRHRTPVTADGHPATECVRAVPRCRIPHQVGHPLTRRNVLMLEELLGPQCAASVMRLKRRAGMLPPLLPLRPYANGTAPSSAISGISCCGAPAKVEEPASHPALAEQRQQLHVQAYSEQEHQQLAHGKALRVLRMLLGIAPS